MIEEEDYKLPTAVVADTPAGETAHTAVERKRKACETLAYLNSLPWRPHGWDW